MQVSPKNKTGEGEDAIEIWDLFHNAFVAEWKLFRIYKKMLCPKFFSNESILLQKWRMMTKGKKFLVFKQIRTINFLVK